jgi:hypothetical protein
MVKHISAAAFAAIVVTGCYARSSTPAAAPTAAVDPANRCPMAVPGTKVVADDTPTGVAIEFTTTGEVEALRARVTELADEHNRAQPAEMQATAPDDERWGDEDDPTFASGIPVTTNVADPGTPQPLILTHSRAVLEPIARGVRLVYIADPENVEALRDEARLHAERLADGHCE